MDDLTKAMFGQFAQAPSPAETRRDVKLMARVMRLREALVAVKKREAKARKVCRILAACLEADEWGRLHEAAALAREVMADDGRGAR